MGRGLLAGLPGEKRAPRHQACASHAAEPGSRTHALGFPEAPGPRQEAGWRLEGGGLSNPELLKRANGEVKIGNKNKIAPASPGCLCRKQGISRPSRASTLRPSRTRNVSPNPASSHPRRPALRPAQGRPKRGPETQVRISALPLTSQVTLGEGLRPCGPRTQTPAPPMAPAHHLPLPGFSPPPGPSPSAERSVRGRRSGCEGPARLSERLRPVSSCARREEGFHALLPCGACRAGVRLTRTKLTDPGFKAGPFSQGAGSLGTEDSPAREHEMGAGAPSSHRPPTLAGRGPSPPASSREALPCWVRLIDRLSLPGAPAERAGERC